MIAADTSSLRRYWAGDTGHDVELVDRALAGTSLAVPPVVLTELLSDPASQTLLPFALSLETLEIRDGYWVRAGQLCARLLTNGFKANMADTLIAQSCIDHGVPLITHDRDFRHFVKAGLKLL